MEVRFTLFLPIDYNPAMAKREKQSNLKISEYKLAEGDDTDAAAAIGAYYQSK